MKKKDPYKPGHWTKERIMKIILHNPADYPQMIVDHFNLQDHYIAALEKDTQGLKARLQDMINIFNAAGVKIPASTLIDLGGQLEVTHQKRVSE